MRSVLCLFILLSATTLFAQKATITLCEGIETDASVGNPATYAKPIKPTSTFKPMGEVSNVHVVATFKPRGKEQYLMFSIVDKEGAYVVDREDSVTAQNTFLHASFTIIQPGDYTMRLLVKETKEVLGEAKFTVLPDDKGPRANGDQPSGQGLLWICDSVDDNWNPVGATGDPKSKEKIFTWKADKGFNVLIKNKPKTPFGTLFLGIVIHNQGEDGKDTGFVNEWQSDQLEENKATMWCTVEPLTSLKPGRYTIYAIDWYTRQTTEHTGNLKQYYAKITVIVK